MRPFALLLAVILMIAIAPDTAASSAAQPEQAGDYSALTEDLERVRQALGIPGMAAAVVQDRQLVWSSGFGYADVGGRIEAGPNTPFGLASVTKPVAATLIMQLVEDGTIALDEPVATYGVDVAGSAGVTVRHLLTHTSEGEPGTTHNYNGNRYGWLGGVVEGATGRTFADLLGEQILVPLEMTDTALNPLNAWDSESLRGLEELRRALGWGDSFEHYPDVYSRLAEPYQFDDDYGITAGMYHLTHSPSAGLNSSVVDLARFDIALDDGLLLGDAARRQMLSPLVATAPGRTDLAYGLGWYVQDYGGTELIWHTGRWAPSTSALYLKIPSADLTFIVLANTDNLTVPFPGIGSGDITHSTPALTFLHHLLFPHDRGYELPSIDWDGDEAALTAQLKAVNDEASLRFLELELWSYRQAYASSGQYDQVAVLTKVSQTVYPYSNLRRNPTFTSTAEKYPVVAPIMGVRTFLIVSKGVVAWSVVVVASLVWMVVRLFRATGKRVRETLIWLAATALVGPVAPLLHRRKAVESLRSPDATAVACTSLFCIAGYGVAWAVAVFILLGLGNDASPVAILGSTLLIPLMVGLLLNRVPTLMKAGIRPYRRAISRGLVGELITVSLVFAVFFPLTLYFDNRLLSMIPYPTSPYFGAMMSILALGGLVVLLPLEYVMARRGWIVGSATPVESSRMSPTAVTTPTIRNAWWLLLTTVGIMVVSIGWAGSSFG